MKPLFNSLPGDTHFKIWFMEGGCQAFLRMCRYNMHKIRSNKTGEDMNAVLAAEFSNAKFAEQFALFDPSDPSKIYLSQPPVGG